MSACRAELIVHPDDIAANFVRIATWGRLPAGFLSARMMAEVAQIEALFVRPQCQRSGVGRALLETLLAECRGQHIPLISVDADPNAAPIYRRWGFIETGRVASGSIPGRHLPRLRLRLR